MPARTTELHERLVQCARQARAVDVRPFELRPASEALSGLVPPVREVLQEALGVCREVLQAYDAVETSALGEFDEPAGKAGFDNDRDSGVFHIGVDSLIGGDAAQRHVADVAFLTVTELRPKVGRVERLHVEQDPWEIVAECGSALRRVEKSLTAIEVVLCQAAHLPAQLSFASQLTRSLEVRQQLTRLRRAITGIVLSDEAQHRALRLVGTAIAMLIGKDVYPDLRIHDRRHLRDLQQRILAWLRQDTLDAEHVRDGHRLWQDLTGFADLLAQVSRRQELVEHDSRVIAHAYGRLLTHDEEWNADTVERLRGLRGLDPELDVLLDAEERGTAAWAPLVRRLHRTLCDGTAMHSTASGPDESGTEGHFR